MEEKLKYKLFLAFYSISVLIGELFFIFLIIIINNCKESEIACRVVLFLS